MGFSIGLSALGGIVIGVAIGASPGPGGVTLCRSSTGAEACIRGEEILMKAREIFLKTAGRKIYYGHINVMAVTVNKVTYSLKPETVDRVEELAIKWGVPKSEVIRRAIDQVARGERFNPKLTPLQALDELQKFSGITQEQADKFNREVRSSRRASGRKRG